MKRKFSKILGAGLTLALLTSLLLTAAPVSALRQLTVTPTTPDDAVISTASAGWDLSFVVDKALDGKDGATFSLPDTGDAVDITAAAATDEAIITVTAGSVSVTFNPVGGTYTASTGLIQFSAAAQVATVSATVDNTAGTWARTNGLPTAAAGNDVNQPIVLGALVSSGDSITITFPVGTTIGDAAGGTIVASPGWIGGAWKTTTSIIKQVWTTNPTARTITITLGGGDEIGSTATVLIGITSGITNPATPAAYTLTVKTSQETTAVTSAAYSITAPILPATPGTVRWYNSAGVPMGVDSTGAPIGVALLDVFNKAGVGWTIEVGPGTYQESVTVDIANTSLTIKPTGTAVDTVIIGNFTIDAASVTVDGFTITGSATIAATGDKATFQNCIFTKTGTGLIAETLITYSNTVASGTGTITGNTIDTSLGAVVDSGIAVTRPGLTISNNTFVVDGAVGAEDSAINVTNATAGTTTISGNTISGASGIGVTINTAASAGTVTATGNTLSNLNRAFNITDTATGTVNIKDNTIDTCGILKTTTVVGQAAIQVTTVGSGGLGITNNTIINCPDDIIEVDANSDLVNMMFNNMTGNTLGVDNDDTNTLNATHNWWGVATGPAAGMNVGTATGLINATAYLGGEATGTFNTGSAALVAKTTVGVDVIATPVATKPAPAIIGVANYAANPQDATPLPALAGGFYDVYLAETTAGDTASVLIKFYNANVTANTKVYIWGTIAGGWQLVTPATAQGVNLYGGFAYATVDPANLTGTPFALVGGAVGAPGTPKILAPTTGDDTVSLTPIFAWEAVAGAAPDGYYFEFADNANFVTPLVKLDGDLGRLIVTAYAYVGDLDYSTAYYWRVKAVSGTVEAGDLAESAWSTGVFVTMDEPVEPTPPIVIEPTPPAPPAPVPIIQPIVEVITPPATPITPAWIYAIIGVGAVLVIALIVLVVRTRRVA